MQFCRNVYFKLRYCRFTKPSGLWYFEIFLVISMGFAVFLCHSVTTVCCLCVFLCSFAVFVPPYSPLVQESFNNCFLVKLREYRNYYCTSVIIHPLWYSLPYVALCIFRLNNLKCLRCISSCRETQRTLKRNFCSTVWKMNRDM